MADQHPKVLGKYEILSVLGRGGMGIVYKAKDPIIGRLVAIKTISATQGVPEDELRQRLQMEAQSAGRLQHPNIATLYDFGTHDELSYIVLEYVEGNDLQQIIDNQLQLTLPQKLDLLVQIAHGLAYAHEFGVVHRDMKPSNVRVSPKGIAKIIDFGLARFDSTRLTRTGFMTGTIAYMSPERIHGETGPSDDVFALGTIGYELMTYRRAFTGSTPPEVMMKIISSSPPPPSTFVKIPATLDAIVMKGMARDVADRYQTAAEYAEAIEEFRLTDEYREFLKASGITDSGMHRRSRASDMPLFASPPTDSMPAPDAAATVTAGTSAMSRANAAAPTQVTAVSDAPTTIVDATQPGIAAATVIEPRPVEASRRSWVVPAAAAVLVVLLAGGYFAMSSRTPSPAGPTPGTGSTTSPQPVASATTVTVAPPSAPTEVEVQRRLLASLRDEVSGLQLNSLEKDGLKKADSFAQLADEKSAQRDFEATARLLDDAIGTLRTVRDDHYHRLTAAPAPKQVTTPAAPNREASPAPERRVPEAPKPAQQPARPVEGPAPMPVQPGPREQPAQPETPKVSREDVQRQVNDFIAKVAHAYESKDASFFRSHDANFTDAKENAIRNSPSVSVEMRVQSIDVTGTDRARVVVQRTDTFGPRMPPGVQRLAYTLQRSGDSWRIVSIERP